MLNMLINRQINKVSGDAGQTNDAAGDADEQGNSKSKPAPEMTKKAKDGKGLVANMGK
jgi:hypothetical protein